MKIFTDKSLHLCFFRFGLMQLRRSSSLWVQALVFSWPLPATILFITTATSTPGSHLYCCHFLLSALRFCYHKLELKMWTLFTLYSQLLFACVSMQVWCWPNPKYYTLAHNSSSIVQALAKMIPWIIRFVEERSAITSLSNFIYDKTSVKKIISTYLKTRIW